MTNQEIALLAERIENYFYLFKDYTLFDFDISDEDMKRSMEQRKTDLTDVEEVDNIIFNVNDCNINLDDSHSVEAGELIKLLQEQRAYLIKNKDKRLVGDTGYEVKQAFHINGKEILLAENMSADDNLFYLVCQYTENGIFCEYSEGMGSDDYLEALQDFTGRISKEAAALQAERDVLNLPADLFTVEHCFPHDYGENIDGKVIAIRADVFSPEYRRGDYQLVWVDGGNGSRANPRGHAVYCYHLNNGKHTRFERYDVLGEVRPEAMPDWAKEGLARVEAEREKPAEEKEFAGRYEIIDRIAAGQKVFALGFCEKAVQPYGTWQGYKNSKGNFDLGNYFSDREAATADLHKRAGDEQKRLDAKKRNDGAR